MIGVIENYRIIEKIGDGGMGAVFRAVDQMLEREVALKMLHPELVRRPEIVERFRAEAITLARLNHPNIATLYGLTRHADTFLMIMEFVQGETLEHLVRKLNRISWNSAVRLCCQALDALEYAHGQGVIHRDIKPANLMLAWSGKVKVMDFGIARVLGTSRKTAHGRILGTLAYMSPEQVRGQEVDGRTDLYSLGVVLYELLTGTVPFHSKSEFDLMMSHVSQPPPRPLSVNPELPDWLDDAIMRALAKSPDDRFQSAAEFRSDLNAGQKAASAPATLPASALDTLCGENAEHLGSLLALAQGETGLTAVTSTPGAGAGDLKPTRVAPQLPLREIHHNKTRRARGRLYMACAAAVLILLTGVITWHFAHRSPGEKQSASQRSASPLASHPVPGLAEPERSGAPSPGASQEASVDTSPAAPHTPAKVAPARRSPTPQKHPAAKRAQASPPAVDPAPPAPEETDPDLASLEPATTPTAEEVEAAARAHAINSLPPASFHKVKLLVIKGDKTKESDVVLRLASDHLVIADETTDQALKSFYYGSISSIVYSESKHPRWKTGIAAPAAVGVAAAPLFFLKGKKHWLTIEAGTDYAVLHLDKDNFRAILPAFETRSGIKVEAAPAEK